MVNQENSDTGRSWSDVWGSPPRDQNNGKIVRTQKYPGYSVAFSKYVSTYCLSTNSCIVESDCCWWILSVDIIENESDCCWWIFSKVIIITKEEHTCSNLQFFCYGAQDIKFQLFLNFSNCKLIIMGLATEPLFG